MESTRAKFKVEEIRRHMSTQKTSRKDERGLDVWEPCEVRTVVLSPVFSDDPNSENHRFWKASPSGKIELGCANLEAAAMFELGKEYYVDFTRAE